MGKDGESNKDKKEKAQSKLEATKKNVIVVLKYITDRHTVFIL